MTLQNWLNLSTHKLTNLGISHSALESQLIAGHLLRKPMSWIVANSDTPLPTSILRQLNGLIKRRLASEPLAYILSKKEFYGLTFKVDSRVLIPRGESEPLVETALKWLSQKPDNQVVAEIGTGSGAIIIALAHNDKRHLFFATDISRKAINVARHNAKTHNVNINFKSGSLGLPLMNNNTIGRVNVLVANLPYITSERLVTLDPTIRFFEPHIALYGGEDGLDLYRQFFPQAKTLMASGGLILCEHEFDQGESMRQLARYSFPSADIATYKDHFGDDRIILIHLTSR